MTEKESKSDKKKITKGYIVSSVILGTAVLIALYITIQTLAFGYTRAFGYSFFRVVTGSMEPEIPVNSVIVCKNVDINTVKEGDVISFKSLEPENYGAIITHKVVAVKHNGEGGVMLESRGTANNTSDRYYVTAKNFIGKVVKNFGREGAGANLIAFLSGKFGFIVLIVFPILVISGFVLQGLGRTMKTEMNEALTKLNEAEKRKRQKQKKEQGEAELLPGYKTVTKENYEELVKALREEIQKEQLDSEEGSESKTEYKDEDHD